MTSLQNDNLLDADDQWSNIVRFLRAADVANLSFGHFSNAVAIEWPTNRLNEPIGPFLHEEWTSILKRRGFGHKKLRQLQTNMLMIATHLGWSPDGDHRQLAASASAKTGMITFEQLGLPASFPISAAFFTERVRDYCASAGIETLDMLVSATTAPGWSASALDCKNFGKSSLAEITRFLAAMRTSDKEKLQEFLPIRLVGPGLDLGAAAFHVAQAHASIGYVGLSKRLVLGQTLEEVANEYAVTRERVRQVESILLDTLQRILDAVPSTKAELWKSWFDSGELLTTNSENEAGIDRFSAAAVDRLFSESELGRETIAAREGRCAECYHAITFEPAFYSGELDLAGFLASQPGVPSVRDLIAWNQKNRAFDFCEAKGTAQAINPRAKQVVAALLHRGDLSVETVLNFLKKIPGLDAWPLNALKRNYQSWRDDPDFPRSAIIFPPPVSLKSRLDLKLRPTPTQSQEAVSADIGTTRIHPKLALGPSFELLENIDQRLRSILAAATDSQSLFGLLPVGQQLQSEAIAALKATVEGGFERLLLCLKELPCVTGYVLVIGPASRMDGLAFYEPLQDYIGFSIPAARRIEFALSFRRAGQQLGLLPIPLKDRTDNVWPFVFQAAIIPRFVDLLISAILQELAAGIPPDVDDPQELGRFARGVASHINPSQQRLRKVLEADAGISVCRVLLRAYQTGDFAQLPPHLETRCAEAFREVKAQQREPLRSPFVAFDQCAGELTIVLPRQPHSLIRPDTIWSVGSAHRASADAEVRIPIREIDQPQVTIALSPLVSRTNQRWESLIELVPSNDSPVWIFDAETGRRVQFKSEIEDGTETCRLPSGRDFSLLAMDSVVSDLSQDAWKRIESGLKSLTYQSFWGQTAITLGHSERELCISCREEPCILITSEEGGRIRMADGEDMLFGTQLRVSFIASSDEVGLGGTYKVRILSANGDEAEGSGEKLQSFVESYVAGLADGIHRIDVEFHASGKTARRKVFFWKGLKYIDHEFGFRCSANPDNIDWANSEGVVRERGGLRVIQQWLLPEVVIAILNPPSRLRIRRPGISVALLNINTGAEEPCERGDLLHVPKNDARRVVVRLEATGRWVISSSSAVVARVEDGSVRAVFRLGDLVGDQANSARLIAKPESGNPVTILRLQRQIAVTGFRVVPDEIERRYYVRFVVPSNVKALAITRTTVPSIHGADKAISTIALGRDQETTEVTGLPNTIAMVKDSDGENLLVELFVPYASLQNNWHVLELQFHDDESSEWINLHVADVHDAYGSRWVFAPPRENDLSNNFVRAVLQLSQNRCEPTTRKFVAPELPAVDKEIHDAFEVVEGLLDYHYSPAGWESAKWAGAGFIWLSKMVQKSHAGVLAQRAVHGLAQRARQADMYRPLHFGASELTATLPNCHFVLPAYPAGSIGECFRLIGERSRHSVTGKMLGSASIAIWPFTHFENFHQVAKSQQDRFQNLKLDSLLRKLSERIATYDPHMSEGQNDEAFSDRRWAQAHSALEKRLSRMRSRSSEGPGPLNKFAEFERRLHHLEFALKAIFRTPTQSVLEWSSLPGSDSARIVLRIVFWTAALGRATAFGRYSNAQFIETLSNVFSGAEGDVDNVRKGLSLCIGLAPEWFAEAMLLWDLVLSDAPSTNFN